MSPTDETAEDTKLDRFRTAAHDLYVAGLPEEVRDRLRGAGLLREREPAMEDATQTLTQLEQEGVVPRLFTLHAVAGAVNRKPALVEEEGSNLAQPIVARVRTRVRQRAGQVEGGLANFASTAPTRPRRLTYARWRQFLHDVGEPDPDRIIVAEPGCNDDEQVPTPTGRAPTIKSRFWTNASVEQMAGLVDPMFWARSGKPFWKQMSPVKGTIRTTNPDRYYTGTFEEVVALPIGDVTVYLDIRFERTADYVHTTYQLAADPRYPKGRVVFDSGWIAATGKTIGPGGEPTLVEGLKSIQFREPELNELPDLACDGGWAYLMINMAREGARLARQEAPAATESDKPRAVQPPPGVDTAKAAVNARIEAAVDTWVEQATASLRSHGVAVKTAVGRALPPGYDPDWVNDLLGTWKGGAETTKHTIEAWRRILDALATPEKDR
jgi:hypothetical protein